MPQIPQSHSIFEPLEDRRLMSAGTSVEFLPPNLLDRINPRLWAVAQDQRLGRQNALVASGSARFDTQGLLQTYVHTDDVIAAKKQLGALGVRLDGSSREMRVVQAWINPEMIDDAALLPAVQRIGLPDYAIRNVTTAGDGIHLADKVRNQFANQGIDGTGIKIGVISDGADHRANVGAELASVAVNPSKPGSGDEGTAMLEIVHDLAPGAQLYFSGVTSSLDMTAGIDWLMTQGCNVIVDDLLFPGEAYFTDSTIAQKAQQAVNAGIAYVTSAGNFADDQHYQTAYVQSASAFGGGLLHRFAAGDDANNVSIPGGSTFRAFLQWSDGWGTSSNNYDLYLFNSGNFDQLDTSTNIQNGNDQPIEWVEWTNTGGAVQAELWIVKKNGAANRELEMFTIGNTSMQFDTPGDALVGQEAVAGVISVAAANASNQDNVTDYSSRGGSTIYTNFSTQTKTVRQTLDGTAIDGVQTKAGQMGFFSNPFYGTSAAAPHAAAIAALVKQAKPSLTPAQVAQTMADTAIHLGAAGYDTTSGAGRYDALGAVYKAFTPAMPDLKTSSDTGISSTDNVTLDNTPLIGGIVPAGSFVEVFIDGAFNEFVALAPGVTTWEMIPDALPDGSHTATIRVSSSVSVAVANRSAFSLALSFTVDTVAPTVVGTNYNWNIAPQQFSAEFSETVPGSVQNSDLILEHQTTDTTVPSASIAVAYDDQNDTAVFTFHGFLNGILPDGEYKATLGTDSVSDVAGNGLAFADETLFFFLQGDANHDRDVNSDDFNILATNFGLPNKTFADGDFNYDGAVNSDDFNVLAGEFGTSLGLSIGQQRFGSAFGANSTDVCSNGLEEILA
jgi:hypothetical protein